MRAFVVAEAGISHDGSVETAIRLVEEAKKAGADAVKFQIFKAERLWSRRVEVSGVERMGNPLTLFERLELSREDWARVKRCADSVGIEFFASVFDEESADLLKDLGARYVKIASGDITDVVLLKYVSGLGFNKYLVSCGGATDEEIGMSLSILPKDRTVLLYCVSLYPPLPGEVDLRAIPYLSLRFFVDVGFSDHFPGDELSLAAVALGASVLEKHFALDGYSGPDASVSLTPKEFASFVERVRALERALEPKGSRISKRERENLPLGRKGLYASRDIGAGETIGEEHLERLRPCVGVPASRYYDIIGCRAKRNIRRGEPIRWEDIG